METIVFDIGGVIFPDIWETIFLKKNGLLKKFDIDNLESRNILEALWKAYAIIPAKNGNWKEIEYQYWKDVLTQLNINISTDECIQYSVPFIKPYYLVEKRIIELLNDKKKVLICSNQTVFWFERQLAVSEVLKRIPRSQMVLSFECGLTKDENPFEIFNLVKEKAEEAINEVLYIDDRLKNIHYAEKFGFIAKKYSYTNEQSIKKLDAIL